MYGRMCISRRSVSPGAGGPSGCAARTDPGRRSPAHAGRLKWRGTRYSADGTGGGEKAMNRRVGRVPGLVVRRGRRLLRERGM
jgi:hypothetical protein